VGERAKSFTIAVSVTVFDIVVVWYDGPIKTRTLLLNQCNRTHSYPAVISSSPEKQADRDANQTKPGSDRPKWYAGTTATASMNSIWSRKAWLGA
jgi:hypothetical protein